MLKYVRIMHIHGFDILRALSHARVLPVIHHGLYVMHEGSLSCMKVCLSCTMTAIMTQVCCHNIMMQT